MLNNIDNKYIGEEIKKARKSRKMTREQLAEATNIDAKQIYRIENGFSSPKLENFIKIAQILDLKIKYFTDCKIPQNQHTNEILDLLKNATEKELELYTTLIKSIKRYTNA